MHLQSKGRQLGGKGRDHDDDDDDDNNDDYDDDDDGYNNDDDHHHHHYDDNNDDDNDGNDDDDDVSGVRNQGRPTEKFSKQRHPQEQRDCRRGSALCLSAWKHEEEHERVCVCGRECVRLYALVCVYAKMCVCMKLYVRVCERACVYNPREYEHV